MPYMVKKISARKNSALSHSATQKKTFPNSEIKLNLQNNTQQ